MHKHFEKRIDDNYSIAKQLFLEGKSLSEIERTIGFSRKKLSSLLKYEGFNIKQNGQKYDCNESAFETIDNEEKAYWLGFLYADGNIRIIGQKSLVLALSKKDEEHLIRFKNFISPNHRITQESRWLDATEKEYNSVRISITNSKIVDDLIDKNCLPEKTFILQFPEWMPQDLVRHFIRGYFDGDGSAAKVNGKSAFGIVGASSEFIFSIEDKLRENANVSPRNIAIRQRPDRNTLYEFRYSALSDIIKLYHYLYNDAIVYLERKHTLLKERVYGPLHRNM